MRAPRISFKELVDHNKKEMLEDQDKMEKIEKQLDDKHTKSEESSSNVN
ncbi:FbpB family small basic protein [Halobacillus rhizosphaerae]